MTYIITDTGITVYANGTRYSIANSHENYIAINKAIGENNQELFDSILIGLESPIVASRAAEVGIVVKNSTVYYDGQAIEDIFADKLISLIKQGFENLDGYKNYLANLMQNPSASSRTQLSEFLQYKELPITPDGCFLAYKGVQGDYYSSNGNRKTKVLAGVVNEIGQILNCVGSQISVDRGQVDDNRRNHCSFGLHVGSLNYAKGFSEKVIVVKVNPKDVVSVPNDCNCQKCRVSAYEVIEDFSKEIVAAQVEIKQGKVIEKEAAEISYDYSYFEKRIKNYVDSKHAARIEPSLRQVRNALRPHQISALEIQSILKKLGYKVNFVDNSLKKSTVSLQ